eukprot:COSAG02_NODE_2107_length_9809_cov_114.047786_1_plen_46_part_00
MAEQEGGAVEEDAAAEGRDRRQDRAGETATQRERERGRAFSSSHH